MQDMITERGVVTAVSEHLITVACRSRMDCVRCAEGKGCGGGILARWLGDRQFQVQAYFDVNKQAPQNGDLVDIALPSSRLVKLAAIMYGLPMLIMLVTLLLQVKIFPQAGDLVSIVFAIVSLFIGFKISAALIIQANRKGHLLPQLQSKNSLSVAQDPQCQKLLQAK